MRNHGLGFGVGAIAMGVVGAAAAPTAAHAQQAPPTDQSAQPAPPADQSARDQAVTDENAIIVTANRRQQNITDVPASVTSIGSELIDNIRANNLNDVSAYVPGLNVQPSGSDGNRLVIRGLSTGGQDLSPSVGVYVDDAPFGATSGFALGALFSPDIDPADLDHVEVLRGPQGTLYGASTLAGLVKYVTRAPDLNEFQGRVSADYGITNNDGATDPSNILVRGGVNLPIATDVAGLRLSAYYQDADGDVTNVRTGETGLNGLTRYGFRANLLIQPSDAFSIRVAGAYAHSSQNTGYVTGNAQTLEPIYDQYSGFGYVDSFARSEYYFLQGTLRYEWSSGVSLSSTTSYSNYDVNQRSDLTTIFAPAFGALGALFEFPSILRPNIDRFTQEIRLSSPSTGRFQWLAGLFYDRENSTYTSAITSTYQFGATPPAALAPTVAALANYETAVNDLAYREYAGFVDGTFSITPDFDIGAGVRYSHNDQHRDLSATGYLVLLGVVPAAGSSTSSDDVITAQFNASWRFSPGFSLYGRVARGYRPGGPNLTGTSFEADTTWNYEAGLKIATPDNRLQADLTAFRIDWSNIQINFFNGTNTVIGNAGDAVSQGVEFEAAYRPLRGLTLTGNLAYTDAHITGLLAGQTTGAAIGDQLPLSSDWAGAARADYAFALSRSVNANFGASLRYKGAFNTGFPGDPGTRFYRLPSTTFFDLRAGLSFGSRFDLNLQVLNVGNVRRLQSASETLAVPVATADALGQPVFLGYSPSRTFTLSAVVRF